MTSVPTTGRPIRSVGSTLVSFWCGWGIDPCPVTLYNTLTRNQPMRFSPATRLADRQMVWVGYRNDGSKFNQITDPVGHTATLLAAQWAETYATDVRQAQWG